MAKATNNPPLDNKATDALLKAAEGMKEAQPSEAPKVEPKTDEPANGTNPETDAAKATNNPPAPEAKEGDLEETAKDDSSKAPEVDLELEEQKKKVTEMLKKYGPDPVLAQRKNEQTIFTRITWNQLKTLPDGTKEGWKEVVEVPEEVRALFAKKQGS